MSKSYKVGGRLGLYKPERPDLSMLEPIEYYDEVLKDDPQYQAAKIAHAKFVKDVAAFFDSLKKDGEQDDWQGD